MQIAIFRELTENIIDFRELTEYNLPVTTKDKQKAPLLIAGKCYFIDSTPLLYHSLQILSIMVTKKRITRRTKALNLNTENNSPKSVRYLIFNQK